MLNSGSSQQNQSDSTQNFFWLLIIFFAAVLLIWWLRPQWIAGPAFIIRSKEISLLIFVYHYWNMFAVSLHLPQADISSLQILQTYIKKSDFHEVSFVDFSILNVYVGNIMRWPLSFLMLISAILINLRHKGVRFRKEYTMQTLREVEQKNWPQITPIQNLDLVKANIDTGPWAMAKVPLQFCKEHNIARLIKEDKRTVWTIAEAPAYRVFALQVGSLWRGVSQLPIHLKALVVIFIACAHRERDIADKFLCQIAESSASGKLDFSGIEAQLLKYKNSKAIKWLESRHAYVGTLLASLLEIAREDGVLATAEFLWLKPVDRPMWYMLNNVGRQTAFVEVAGMFAHWLAEKRIGRPLKVPMVKEAVKALELSMRDTLYVAESEKWHTLNVA